MVKLSNKINAIVIYICMLIFFILFSLMFAGVVFRYVFKNPIIFEYETSIILSVWLVLLGSTVVHFYHEDISINSLVNVLPQKARKLCIILVRLGVIVLSIILVKEGFKLAQVSLSRYFMTIPISISWLYAALPISFTLSIFYSVVDLFWKQDRLKK